MDIIIKISESNFIDFLNYSPSNIILGWKIVFDPSGTLRSIPILNVNSDPRKVRFQHGLSASSIPIATNVSFYNPNVPGIKPGIKWKSIKNKYYMVYRTANPTSNSALSPINNLTEWVKGTGKIMFMQDLNSHQNGRQYMYIVASPNSPKPYYTGTNGGSYSTPILGCNGQIIFPF